MKFGAIEGGGGEEEDSTVKGHARSERAEGISSRRRKRKNWS